MKAWAVVAPGPIETGPMRLVTKDVPQPGPGEVLVRVRVCGVCRTDLHLAEGDLAPHGPARTPGHEVVGTVEDLGPGAERFALGERVGIAWLRHACGRCQFCGRGRENLCPEPLFTGWDVDGGFAEFAVVPQDFAYSLPESFSDEEAAPLLCAGIIGYRALRRAELPRGGRLGIYGFGASAHLAAQVAMAEGAGVYVMTRSEASRQLAAELGAVWTGDTYDRPPDLLDAAIVFAPAGEVVPSALASTGPGGTVAVAGIHLSDIPTLDYRRHLFMERQLRSVTANTRQDGAEFLALAARIPIQVTTVAYPLEGAAQALSDLHHDRFSGAAVLRVGN